MTTQTRENNQPDFAPRMLHVPVRVLETPAASITVSERDSDAER